MTNRVFYVNVPLIMLGKQLGYCLYGRGNKQNLKQGHLKISKLAQHAYEGHRYFGMKSRSSR